MTGFYYYSCVAKPFNFPCDEVSSHWNKTSPSFNIYVDVDSPLPGLLYTSKVQNLPGISL